MSILLCGAKFQWKLSTTDACNWSLLKICKLQFGKAFEADFFQEFEAEILSWIWSWIFVKIGVETMNLLYGNIGKSTQSLGLSALAIFINCFGASVVLILFWYFISKPVVALIRLVLQPPGECCNWGSNRGLIIRFEDKSHIFPRHDRLFRMISASTDSQRDLYLVVFG